VSTLRRNKKINSGFWSQHLKARAPLKRGDIKIEHKWGGRVSTDSYGSGDALVAKSGLQKQGIF
jgi:hypothetical protein